MVADTQVRRLMKQVKSESTLSLAAAKADLLTTVAMTTDLMPGSARTLECQHLCGPSQSRPPQPLGPLYRVCCNVQLGFGSKLGGRGSSGADVVPVGGF